MHKTLMLDSTEYGKSVLELLLELKGDDNGYAAVISSYSKGKSGSRWMYWFEATVDEPGILGDKPRLMDRHTFTGDTPDFDRSLQFQDGSRFTVQADAVVELVRADGTTLSATELSLEDHQVYIGRDYLPVCLVSGDEPDLTPMQRLRFAKEVLMRSRPGHQPYPRLSCIDASPLVDDLVAAVQSVLVAHTASRFASE